MEVRLLVITHKDGFGSIPYFSESMKKNERQIIESVKYSDYHGNDLDIFEVEKSGYYIYFINYVGGKDEFGRNYRTILSTIFPFELTPKDKVKVSKVFKDVRHDLSVDIDTFLLKSYFTEIKGNIDPSQVEEMKFYRSKKRSRMFLFTLIFLLTITTLFTYFYYFSCQRSIRTCHI